jgi:hypothetical protein
MSGRSAELKRHIVIPKKTLRWLRNKGGSDQRNQRATVDLAFARLLALRRLEIRSNGVGASRQSIIETAGNSDSLDLIQLLDEVIERRCLERGFAFLQFERLLAIAKLKINCARSIDPELLAGDPLAFAKQPDLRDLLVYIG